VGRGFRILVLIVLLFITASNVFPQAKVLINMDLQQSNHLKAYGVVYRLLMKNRPVDWLLNYRGGSFMINYSKDIEDECSRVGVSYDLINGTEAAQIYAETEDEKNNMETVRLETAAKIAVYVPPNTLPWDDAVRLALEYAEIPYDSLWDAEVLQDKLKNFDWLHLHHEDFTGQYGKFFGTFGTSHWYITQKTANEEMAKRLGFAKVSKLKLAVVKKLNEYVAKGGFLFTMCSGTDTYDIALASQYTDICESMYDGDPADPEANNKLDYSDCLAFENFKIIMNPYVYEYSDLDITDQILYIGQANDYFRLVDFSAKYDPVPTMLNQSHTSLIKGTMGQTSGFKKQFIKKNVTILGLNENTDFVRYIHGNYGKGTFTFYGGHDPEDYQHLVGDPPTNLDYYKNSPGYRLILNNVLFPSAKKKKLKT